MTKPKPPATTGSPSLEGGQIIPPPEWLPDWRDPAAYPKSTAHKIEWAWEFLRRMPEYRSDYSQAARSNRLDSNRYTEKWRLTPLQDPAKPRPVDASFRISSVRVIRRGLPFESWRATDDHHVAIVFDLSAPLEDQLKGAGGALRERADEVAAIDPDLIRKVRKPRRDKFRTYLRLLDAVATGVNFSRGNKAQIAQQLYGRETISNLDAATNLLDKDLRQAEEYLNDAYFLILDMPTK